MDGLFSLVLLAYPGQGLLGGLADLGVLAASIVLAILSALILVRQILFAMFAGD
jgi:hypothetical protein